MSSSNVKERKTTLAQQFCVENWQWLLQQCRSLLKGKGVPNYVDVAQDLAQTVFVLLASVNDAAWGDVRNRPGYVFNTAKNEANQYHHKTWREEAVDPSDFMNVVDKQGSDAADKRLVALLFEELRRMCTEDERDLLDRLHQGYTPAEIATQLGIKEPTLRKRLSRLNAKLLQLARGDKDPP